MNRFIKTILGRQSFFAVYKRTYTQIQALNENQESQKILDEAEKILGDRSFRNIYWLIPDNISDLATLMQQSENMKHLIADAASIVSNNDITLGMIAMLLSKITETHPNLSKNRNSRIDDIVEVHYAIARVTEMFNITMKVHRSLSYKASAHLCSGNKIAVLIGDYLLAQSFNELAVSRNYNLLEFMGSALRDLVEGQYFGPMDKNNIPYPFKPPEAYADSTFLDTFSCDPIVIPNSTYNCKSEWILRNTLGNSGLLGKACFSILKTAGYSQEFQNIGYSFGKYFSLAHQALQDINDFYLKTDSVNLVSLPVLLHLEKDKELYKHIEECKDNIEAVDVNMVRQNVLRGVAIEETYRFKKECVDAVFNILNVFESCDAQNLLQDLINYIDRK